MLLAYNNSPARITFAVSWHGSYFQYSLPSHATVTFQWGPEPAASSSTARSGPASGTGVQPDLSAAGELTARGSDLAPAGEAHGDAQARDARARL